MNDKFNEVFSDIIDSINMITGYIESSREILSEDDIILSSDCTTSDRETMSQEQRETFCKAIGNLIKSAFEAGKYR